MYIHLLIFRKSICVILLMFFVFSFSVFAQNSDASDDAIIPPKVNSSDTVPAVSSEESFVLSDQETTQQIEAPRIGIGSFIRVIGILVLVLAIVYGIVWVLRKIQNKSIVNSDAFDEVATRAISHGNVLHLVKIGSNFLLLGSSNQSIHTLKEFSEKEEIDEIQLAISKAESEAYTPKKNNFLAKLYDVIGAKRNKKTLIDSHHHHTLSELKKQVMRGKNLNGNKSA